jgi:hypothetical protein
MIQASDISAILGVSGKVPRRAAVRDGRLVQADAASEEVHCLSRVCELVTASLGNAVHSRIPTELLESCLATNDPGAWKALCEDIASGCVPVGTFGDYFNAHPGQVGGLVRSLIDARSAVHSVSVVRALSFVLAECTARVRSEIAACMHSGRGTAAVQVFTTHAHTLPHDVRLAAFEAFGEVIPSTDVAQGIALRLAAHMQANEWTGSDNDAVHVLSCCKHLSNIDTPAKRALADALVHAIPKMPATKRGPALRTLAKVIHPHEDCEASIVVAVDAMLGAAAAAHSEESTTCGAGEVLRAASFPNSPMHMLASRLLRALAQNNQNKNGS